MAAGCLWFALRGSAPAEVAAAWRDVDVAWAALSLATMLLLIALRAARWVVVARAVAPVPWASALRWCVIGFAAIDLFPVRLGELVRPALLARRGGVPFGAGAATVVYERLLDLAALLVFLIAAVAVADLPSMEVPFFGRRVDLAVQGRDAILILLVGVGAPGVALVAIGERGLGVVRGVARLLPAKLATAAVMLAEAFVAAGRRVGRPRVVAATVALSAAAWTVNLVVAWSLLRAFGFPADFGMADVVMIGTAVFLLLPNPGGGVGVFEAGAVASLALYGHQGPQVAAVAVALHLMHVGAISLVGGVAAYQEGLSWRAVWRVSAPASPAT